MLPLRSALCIGLALLPAASARAQAAEDLTLTAPDGEAVVIDRDSYGVPHITAATETAAFFGQGFAVAQDRLYQMELFWRAALGRTAELDTSAGAAAYDRAIRTVMYTPAEREGQFASLSAPVRAMIEAYVAGINTYIDSTESNPARYRPLPYARLPLSRGPIARWDVNRAVGVLQFFMRRFGEVGGQELLRLGELQAHGPAWFSENRPINSLTAFVTVPGPAAVTAPPSGPARPHVDPAVIAAEQARRRLIDGRLSGMGVPRRFGSFAAVVAPWRSEEGLAMLLGAPQMGGPVETARSVTSEVELRVGPAASPLLHVAGMTVPGIPGVIIGRTADRAWTLTTGYTDNTDTYVETLDATGRQYLYEGRYRPLEVVPQTIRRIGQPDLTVETYRTVHGPVYLLDAANGQAFSFRYAFRGHELDMVEAFHDVWRAESREAVERAARRVTMSFNLFYADRDGTIAYWHVGRYPQRPAAVDPRLPALGTGAEEWAGWVPFERHPQVTNPPQGYLVNWNNKPAAFWNQGDNVDWAPWAGRTYDGARYLAEQVEASGPVSAPELAELFRVVRTNPRYPSYPGTYQQIVGFSAGATLAVNVVPPGQSGFVSEAGVPSPNGADQWPLYTSSLGDGPIQLKPFLFLGERVVGMEGEEGR